MKKGKLSMICLLSFLIFFESALISEASVPVAVLKQKEAVVTLLIYEIDNLIAYGSGFITDSDGIIATNYHVISALSKNPDASIAIRLENGKFVKAQKILSFDKTNDVVLIKVEGKGLPSLKLSNDYKPRQGEDVFVIGSPFGFETTITNGIISSIRGTDEFLQITAPISPGSSGSPVFNANGDVIGIATLIMQGGQNLNFAIPVKYITKMDKDLQITKTEPLKSTIPSSVIKPKNESQARNYGEHLRLAREYAKKEQWNNAVDEYTKAISIKPDNAYLYFGRGEASRDLRISLSDYSKAIAMQSYNASFYFYRALIYKIKEEYKNAIKDLDKAIALMPDVSFLYSVRGVIYHEIKQYKMAIDDYTKAIDLKPDRYKYYIIRYAPFKELGYSQEELNEITKGFSTEEELESLYFKRAESYKENLQINEAINDCEKIKNLLTYPNLFFFLIIDLYEQADRFDDAIKYLNYAITIYPKEFSSISIGKINLFPKEDYFYLRRGFIYQRLKEYYKAVHDYSKAIEINPSSSAYSGRGFAYSDLKQYDKAIKDLNKAIALSSTKQQPESIAFNYLSRGDIYVKTDQKQKALEDFQKACDLMKNKLFCGKLKELQREIARGKKWVFIVRGQNKSYYYDETSMRQQPNKNKRVWIRMEVDDVNLYFKEVKDKGIPVTGYENFSHQASLFEVDCNVRASGEVSFVSYDDKGNALHSYNYKPPIELTPIVPDSIGESFFKVVCEGKRN